MGLLGPEPLLQITTEKPILKDAHFCGELGQRTVRRSDDRTKQDNSCFQKCKWKPNPYYKTTIPWELLEYDDRDKCNNAQVIQVLVTAPNLPTNLSCLEKCFDSVIFGATCPKIATAQKFCAESNKTQYNFDVTVDTKIDCMMKQYVIDDKTSKFLSNQPFGDENVDYVINDSVASPFEKFKDNVLRASNSLQLALEICALARHLFTLNQNNASITASYELFNNRNCFKLN